MKKILTKCVSVNGSNYDVALFVLRLLVGSMMLSHGWGKLMNFGALSAVFPDPIGLGSTLSLSLMVMAEVGCSLLLIFGLATRPAAAVLGIGMGVAAFVAHAGDVFQAKELALLYLGLYIVILLAGAGKFSLDYLISKKLKR